MSKNLGGSITKQNKDRLDTRGQLTVSSSGNIQWKDKTYGIQKSGSIIKLKAMST